MTPDPILICVMLSPDGALVWGFDQHGETDGGRVLPMDRPSSRQELASAVTGAVQASAAYGKGSCPILVAGAPGDAANRVLVPVRLEQVAQKLQTFGNVHFLPNLSQTAPPDLSDGAEVSLFGIDESDGLVCVPGTLTRHFEVVAGRLVAFTTEMTSELQVACTVALEQHRQEKADQSFVEAVFVEWAERSLDTDNAVSSFAVHAAMKLGQLAAEHRACALSGLLIGAEIAAHYDPGDDVILVADDDLAERYGLVLDVLGADVVEYSAKECQADGMWEMAELAGLLSA